MTPLFMDNRYLDVNWFDRLQSASLDYGVDINWSVVSLLVRVEEDHIQRKGFPKYFYVILFDYCHRNKIDRVTEDTIRDFLYN